MPDLDMEAVVRKPETAPAPLEDTVVVPAQEAEGDVVLQAVEREDPANEVLKSVLYGLAEEQSSLRSLRKKKEGEQKDSSHISMKRGMLLKYMSETLLQRQALVGNAPSEIDFRSTKFREVFRMFLQTIADTIDEVRIPPEHKELFFLKLTKNLEGWEDKAEKIAKSTGNANQALIQ
jgi:hypothetical protein